MKYSTGFKESQIKKVLPPSNRSVKDVSQEAGISIPTLRNWITLRCHTQKKYAVTTDSKHNNWIPDNLLNREFNPDAPNQKIAGDITYIKVGKDRSTYQCL